MHKIKTIIVGLALFSILLLAPLGCTKKSQGPEFWIYTSTYNHVVQALDKQLQQKFPNVTFKWYQSGSENVAAKVTSELLAGKTQADLLMTADLFWYEDLKKKKALLVYDSPLLAKVPVQFKDPDHTWSVSRLAVMVMAYNSDVISEKDAPKSFADLTLPKFQKQSRYAKPS